jgi:hypothetical protein
MIVVYEGIPGSGKSVMGVAKIAEILRLKRRVYTNVDGLWEDTKDSHICREALRLYTKLTEAEFKDLFHPLGKEEVEKFWDVVQPGGFIVLDEIHLLWSNRDWQTTGNKAFAGWASTHRHHSFDLILITQKLEKVDAHVRSLVEWTYKYKKVNYLGKLVKNSYRVAIFTEDQHDGEPFQWKSGSYDKKIFKCYKSYSHKDLKEQGIATTHNVLRHPIFFIIPLVMAFAIYQIGWKSHFFQGNFFGMKLFGKKANAAEPAPVAKVPGALAKVQPVPLPEPGYYKDGKFVKQEKSRPDPGEGVKVEDAEVVASRHGLWTSAGNKMLHTDKKGRQDCEVVILGEQETAGEQQQGAARSTAPAVGPQEGPVDIKKAMAEVEVERLKIRMKGRPTILVDRPSASATE